jgi:putative lipoprotein
MRAPRILQLAFALFIAVPQRSGALEPEPWFGPDKLAHFGASAGLASAGYGLGAVFFERPEPRLFVGAGMALGLGTAKELFDQAQGRGFSARDLAWVAAGTLVGLSLSWVVDRFVLGHVPSPPPSLGASESQTRAQARRLLQSATASHEAE